MIPIYLNATSLIKGFDNPSVFASTDHFYDHRGTIYIVGIIYFFP